MRSNYFRRLIGGLGALALAGLLGYFTTASVTAQTTVTQTTTASAVSLGATTVSLTSATGIAVGSELFMDREAMYVTALSGTTATVIRGYDGSRAAAHASGVTLYAGPATGVNGSPFVMSGPAYGTCTATSELYSLQINPNSGHVWKCVNGEWTTINDPYRQAVEVHNKVGAAIASATTIAPVSFVTHVTGTTAIATITPPPGCEQTCQIVLIPDALGSTTNAGNIYIASTFVVSKALIMTWDGTKWSPSY